MLAEVGLNWVRFVRDGHNFRHSAGEGFIRIDTVLLIDILPPPGLDARSLNGFAPRGPLRPTLREGLRL
jgi:hypothetical protein